MILVQLSDGRLVCPREQTTDNLALMTTRVTNDRKTGLYAVEMTFRCEHCGPGQPHDLIVSHHEGTTHFRWKDS